MMTSRGPLQAVRMIFLHQPGKEGGEVAEEGAKAQGEEGEGGEGRVVHSLNIHPEGRSQHWSWRTEILNVICVVIYLKVEQFYPATLK